MDAQLNAVLAGLSGDVRDERIGVPGGEVSRVAVPRDVEELCRVVEAAGAARAGLLVVGGGTKLELANRAGALSLGVSMKGITGIDEFEPDEGVLHARAGTPIEEIRQVVAKEGWELPLDAPDTRSTVGGTLSTAVAGPRAQAFGPVKDAILGLEVVGGDGVATKCGGRVVKNVTGYDMAKLYCGSFGSLAIVSGAWLRLRPAPALRLTLASDMPRTTEAFEAARRLSRLVSVRALVWSEDPAKELARVTVELGGSAEGVAHDREQLEALGAHEETTSSAIDHLRDGRAHANAPVALRARVISSRTDEMRRAAIEAGLPVSSDPGLGVVHAAGELASLDGLLALRAKAESLGGFAAFETLPEAWRGDLCVFGSLGGNDSIVQDLKARFDPSGILNPGRFVTRDEREPRAEVAS